MAKPEITASRVRRRQIRSVATFFTAAGRRLHLAALLVACLLSILPGRAHAAAGPFEAANRAYEQGRFSEAKIGYEKLVEAGEWSANLFYNLGNADHRLGAPGRAILDYERALALDPEYAPAWAAPPRGGSRSSVSLSFSRQSEGKKPRCGWSRPPAL